MSNRMHPPSPICQWHHILPLTKVFIKGAGLTSQMSVSVSGTPACKGNEHFMPPIRDENIIVRIVKDWDYPNVIRQTPGNLGFWDNVEFTVNDIYECDYVIISNYLSEDLEVFCPAENIWVIIQEPFLPMVHPWHFEGHRNYSRVFTPFVFSSDPKYCISHPMLPWHIDISYDNLIKMTIPVKRKTISMISSGIDIFPDHKIRNRYMGYLMNKEIDIDYYGRTFNYLENKLSGLLDYNYSIAIENSVSDNYWTEKLSDCFLSYTMPVYYGCSNIDKFFPKNSMIHIDINKPEESLKIIQNAIYNNYWEKYIKEIITARNLVLNTYNIFPSMVLQVKENIYQKKRKKIILKKFKPSVRSKIKLKMMKTLFG